MRREFPGKSQEMGSVEEGEVAGLVLLDANPLEDSNNAKQIDMVIKIIDRGKLDLSVNQQKIEGGRQ